MKIMSRTIGIAVVSGLVMATGCVVEQRPGGRYAIRYNIELYSLKQRAFHGDRIAQYTLARCYATHRGVPQNFVEAVKWYRRSAEQGYAPAQYRLGLCYAYGPVVQPNPAEAMRLYQLAANQGYVPAQRSLERLTSQTNPSMPAPPPPAEDHISVAEVKELSKDNKPDAVIAQIKESNSKYSPQEIAELQQDSTIDRAVIDYIKNNATSSSL